jgi:hypothetical protein
VFNRRRAEKRQICAEASTKREGLQMSSSKTGRRLALCLSALATTVLAFASVTHAAKAIKVGPPTVATGDASHVQATSATLLGAVNPRGAATSYHFEYGPTTAYGKQTTPASLPAGTVRVKVGQAATGLLPGYHYRLVASNEKGLKPGKDKTFAGSKVRKAKFKITKPTIATAYGGALNLTGLLSGTGNGARKIVLQESPYPYLAPFATIGAPIATDSAGAFTFHVSRLLTSTQYRVSTLDPRPLYSSLVTVSAALRVTLKVRTSSHKGLVRLYGTVTPASVGARVTFQLRKAVRPGNTEKTSERTSKFATRFSTTTKRATKTVSRFSAIVKVQQGGSYRAEVTPAKKGAFAAGDSATVLLHSAPPRRARPAFSARR